MLNKIDTPLKRCNLKFSDAVGPDSVQTGLFEGYASTFGNIDAMGDTIMSGAFADTIDAENRSAPVMMLANHNSSFPIGKWLDLAEDDNGLYCHGELTPGHSVAQNVYASMRHGAISGLSIGFRPKESEDIESGGRRISKIDLVEISVVGFPADNDARIQIVKSEIEEIKSVRDCELFLRDAGFSRGMAKALIGQLRPLYLREAEEERKHEQAQAAAREWLRDLILKQRK